MNNIEIGKELQKITNKVIADYNNNRAIDNITDVFNQIDRDVIFECLVHLLSIIYPGFFREKSYKIYNIGSSATILLEDIQFHLSKQLYKALKNTPMVQNLDDEEIHNKSVELTLEFLNQIPNVRNSIEKDLQAAYDGDPAAYNFDEIIISYPGLYAISVYRLAHELYKLNIPLIPRIMTEYAHSKTGIDIHPGATIGDYFFIDHGTGIVIGQSTIIGNNVKIYQGVTLGALSTHGGQSLRDTKRHPTIEDDVTIYANATILGGETVIGKGTIICGSAFVTRSVKPNSRVSVKTQELQIKNDNS